MKKKNNFVMKLFKIYFLSIIFFSFLESAEVQIREIAQKKEQDFEYIFSEEFKKVNNQISELKILVNKWIQINRKKLDINKKESLKKMFYDEQLLLKNDDELGDFILSVSDDSAEFNFYKNFCQILKEINNNLEENYYDENLRFQKVAFANYACLKDSIEKNINDENWYIHS